MKQLLCSIPLLVQNVLGLSPFVTTFQGVRAELMKPSYLFITQVSTHADLGLLTLY